MDTVDFFISYNQADKHWACGIGNWLDQALYTSILQAQDFVPGTNFVLQMHDALQKAKRVIAVLSPDYLTAPFPASEWSAAFAKDPTGMGRTLILVRVRPCEPPGLLKPLVYIDLVDLHHDKAREKLLSGVKAAIEGSQVPPPQKRGVRRRSSGAPETPSSIHQEIKGDRNIQVAAGQFIVTPKHITKNVIQPGPEHITDEQAFQIKQLIDRLAEIDVEAGKPDSHGQWYKRLQNRYRITSYKLLSRGDFEDAGAWLRQQVAMAQPKLRRTNNASWRDHKYRAIWTKARELGLNEAQVHELANERLGLKKRIVSLKKLGEQNLMKFYRIMTRM